MTPEPDEVRAWALVLDSQGIPYQIAHHPDGLELVLHPRDAERAAFALEAYARENTPDELPRPAISTGRSFVAPAAALLLVAFHAVTGTWSSGSWWFAAGAADAQAIRQGELWRLVTALTLHADLGHVMANAVALALFGMAVASIAGSGVAIWLVLLSGVVGNAATVSLRWGAYSGVGASTAVFGAVGVLAGIQAARPRRRWGTRSQAVASGLLLLALLGMSEQSDVLAHVLGFLSGILIGVAWSRFGPAVAGRALQWVLVASACLAVMACWWLAVNSVR